MRNIYIKYIIENQFVIGLLFLVFGLFLFEIRQIIILFFISYIITAAFLPVINFISRKFPRGIAVLITYVVGITLIVALIFPLVPFFLSQIQSLINSFPKILNQAGKVIGIHIGPSEVSSIVRSEIGTLGKDVYSVTSKIFGGIFSALAVFVLSFYLSLDYDRIKHQALHIFPKDNRERVSVIFSHIEEKLGSWLRGQILLSISIGILTWIALTLLGLDFALPLALIAGMLEIVPTIGPIISAVPAIIVALTISPAITFIVIINYIIIQMFENNVLVPKIMEKSVGLNPIVIIAAIMVGSKLMGILGALLAIPFISLLIIIFNNIFSFEKRT